MNKTVHFIVSGRVQGVFFRASTRNKAMELGLGGWVKNLTDGRVEGQASGAAADVDKLAAWLSQGPEMARVLKLEVNELDYQPFNDFVIS